MCDNSEKKAKKIDDQIKQVIARIKAEREKARISQMDLSFMAGLSQNLINYIESGKRTPNLYTILKICDALQIDPACLFSATDEERCIARETIINLARKYI